MSEKEKTYKYISHKQARYTRETYGAELCTDCMAHYQAVKQSTGP